MATMNSGLGGPEGYGEDAFTNTSKAVGDNDDGSVNIDISSVFGSGIDLFGQTYTDLYINSNGSITFGGAEPWYTETLDTADNPMFAPFLTDVDLSKGGEIYWDLDAASGKVTVTWSDVAPYSGSGNNSFQVVLTDKGDGDFDVEYIYGDIQYANGGFGTATAGIADGDGWEAPLEGSGDAATMSGYDTYDFGGGSDGTTATGFSNGEPAGSTTEGTGGDDNLGLGFIDALGNQITDLADFIDAGAGDDLISGGAGNDTILGGSGNDTILSGSGGDTPISWSNVANGANIHGTDEQDFYVFSGGAGTGATLRFNNSPTAGDSDGGLDYLHVDTTADNIYLTIGDFDPGMDKIVLNEGYSSVTTSVNSSNNVSFTVTYANGNQQTFSIYHSGGDMSASEVFTTTLPTSTGPADDNDSLLGGDDADTFLLQGATGNDTIIGGEGGTDGDLIDASDLTEAVDIDLTSDEAGILTTGSDVIDFSEIESFELTDLADTFDASGTDAAVSVDGGGGADLLTGGGGLDTIHPGWFGQ